MMQNISCYVFGKIYENGIRFFVGGNFEGFVDFLRQFSDIFYYDVLFGVGVGDVYNVGFLECIVINGCGNDLVGENDYGSIVCKCISYWCYNVGGIRIGSY